MASKISYLFYSTITLLLLLPHLAMAEQHLIVKHYQQQNRYEYGLKLLDLALSKLDISYQIDTPTTQNMNEARGEIKVIEGKLDLQWMSTNSVREREMIPVKIPIYQGLLGLRLLLIKQEDQHEFSKISSIEQLRQYVGGHGTHWGDLPVYAANNLKVRTSIEYESLFEMLALGRFDYFHRGLNEIWVEANKNKTRLAIANNIMLFYPHPVYFFVTKSRPELAKLIEKGLNIAIADGSFKDLFLSHHAKHIEQGELDKRLLIVLSNPVLTTDTPTINTNWWLPTKFNSQLSNRNVLKQDN